MFSGEVCAFDGRYSLVDSCGQKGFYKWQKIARWISMRGSIFAIITVGMAFGLTLRSQAQINDDFSRALTMGSSASGSNVGASLEVGEPSHVGFGSASSVWYRWSPTQNGTASFSISSSGLFTEHVAVVYSGTVLSSLRRIASATSFAATGTFIVTGGTTYYIAVDSPAGVAAGPGSFRLTRSYTASPGGGGGVDPGPAPSNDNFELAKRITTLPHLGRNETTTGATRESGESRHSSSVGLGSVWYRWTATSEADIQLSVEDNAFRTTLAVYTGTGVRDVRLVTRDWELSIVPVTVEFTAVAGETYHIAVESSRRGTGGTFDLRMEASAPANDLFENAIGLQDGLPVTSDNSTATSEGGEPDHLNRTARQSVWYSFTTGSAEAYQVTWTSTSGLHHVAVYEGDQMASLDPRNLLELDTGSFVLREEPGTDLHFAVDSSAGNAGAFQLEIEPVQLAYTVWRDSIPDFPQGAAGEDADPDVDGLPNVVEMLLGTDPLSANAPDQPTISEVDGSIDFQYHLSDSPIDGVLKPRLVVEISLDLQNWTVETPVSLPDGGFRVRSSPNLVPSWYVRLRSEQP